MKRIAFIFVWILVFSIPWQNIVTIPGLGTFTRFIGFGAIAVAGIYILIKQNIKEPPLMLILMILFVVWSFLTWFWSINQGATISRTITNVQLLVMVWLIWEICDNRKEIYSIMQAYVLGAYVSIIDMISTFLTSPAGGIRIAATGFDQNELAATLAIGIPIAWYLFLRNQKGVLSWVNMAYILFALFGIILTASRGGLLIAAMALFIIPLTLFDLHKRARYIIIVFLAVVSFSSLLYLPEVYPKLEENVERLKGTPGEIREGTMANRRVIWNAGIQVYKDNPILGVGAHGYRFAVQGFGVDPSTGVRVDYFHFARAPHNTYLSVLVDTGLIGFLLFATIFVIALIAALYSDKIAKKFYVVLFVVLLIALIPLGWEYNKSTWFILTLFLLNNALVIRDKKLKIITI